MAQSRHIAADVWLYRLYQLLQEMEKHQHCFLSVQFGIETLPAMQFREFRCIHPLTET